MPTIRQKKAAEVFVDKMKSGEIPTAGEVLKTSDYSEWVQKKPSIVFDSDGFKEALNHLGFSEEAADLTIAKILRTGKEENKIKAAQEIYKRQGSYAPEKSIQANTTLDEIQKKQSRLYKEIREKHSE